MIRELEERICDERSGEWLTASRELAAKLPEYQMDETGGLKEWSLPQIDVYKRQTGARRLVNV